MNGGLDAYGPGVLAGEHTDEILAALGRSAPEIAALRGGARRGVRTRRVGVTATGTGAASVEAATASAVKVRDWLLDRVHGTAAPTGCSTQVQA